VSTITAAAFSLALLTTAPPPAGLHTTPSRIVLTWDYMKRWKQITPAAVASCGGCHMVIVPKSRRDLRGIRGIGYGKPAEIPLPSTALLLGSGIGSVMIAKRWRKQ
jgi:hypothetical protein